MTKFSASKFGSLTHRTFNVKTLCQLIALSALSSIHVLATDTTGQPLLEYAEQCKSLIGQIPAFDCRDGTIVPITINGNEPEAYPVDDCDKPSLLIYEGLSASSQCSPYSRIHNLSYDEVQISAFCRRKYVRPKNDPHFDEIDIILHNVSTGDTCWFHSELEGPGKEKGIDASRVPPPNEVQAPAGYANSDSFWWSPRSTASKECGGCHDADPFMYSPYIGQVWHEVPTDAFGWYNNHIGPEFSKWEVPKAIHTRENTCTSCHRIGNLDSCAKGILASTAGYTHTRGGNAFSKRYPNSHWMPVNNNRSKAFWDQVYQGSLAALLTCCSDPDNAQCEYSTIGRNPDF